jgi:molybdopterin molybdotransferase
MTPEQAWETLEPHLPPRGRPPAVERVPRARASGRVVAADLLATLDVPGTDVSAMDGYAYAGEVPVAAVRPVTATIAAGDAPGWELAPGTAARIMTGAPVPAAADRVVPVELTHPGDGGGERVVIDRPVTAGANIRRRGEVSRPGEPILASGTTLSPGALALVATHGYGEIPVFVRPTVAVLTTGDEVVSADSTPAPGQLRDSHTDFLLAAGGTLGVAFESLGIAPDDRERLAERVRAGLGSDLLLIGGGVSMGDFDLVESVLESAGCEILFERVSIQPGKPLVAARHAGGLVFGLPGNPAAVMACFWLFVRPVLRRLQGLDDRFWNGALEARLEGVLPAAGDRDRFLPALVSMRDGELGARPVIPRGSHDLGAYALGSALVRIRAGAAEARPGGRCEILPLADWPPDPGLPRDQDVPGALPARPASRTG